MKSVLIDTDVILDFFFNRDPFSQDAAILFSLCELGKIRGYITPVICSNVYYLLRKTSKHQRVVNKLSQLLTIIDILKMDKSVVLDALSSGFKDFEDALQYHAASKAGNIDAIITRNIKDYAKSNLSVFTPGDFLATLKH